MKQKIFYSFLLIGVLFVFSSCTSSKVVEVPDQEEEFEVPENLFVSKWADSKERGEIADEGMKGAINDNEVVIENVTITKRAGNYSWVFSNKAAEEACKIILVNDAINLETKDLVEGTLKKSMDEKVAFNDYYAYYHYQLEDGNPMSVNVDWEATLVVENIEKEAKKVKGFARFKFMDDKTEIEGNFEADLCE